MAKKHTKSEKLDLILSELSELKDAVKKLLKEHASDSDQGLKARNKVKKPTVARKKPAKAAGPSKPVLVPTPPEAATG